MYIGPDLVDYRPILRGWTLCKICGQRYHPEEFHYHTEIVEENEKNGGRMIVHNGPKRRIDESD